MVKLWCVGHLEPSIHKLLCQAIHQVVLNVINKSVMPRWVEPWRHVTADHHMKLKSKPSLAMAFSRIAAMSVTTGDVFSDV